MAPTPLLSATELGDWLSRNGRVIVTSAERALFAPPGYRLGRQPLWTQTDAAAYLSHLHPYAAVVPASTLAKAEMASHGVYACPGDSGDWIGLDRPQELIMYGAGVGDVYRVNAVEVVDHRRHRLGPIPATRPAGRIANNLDQARRNGGFTHEILVVFFLDLPSEKQLLGLPVVQKGRVVPLSAKWSGSLLPGIDVAFPRSPLVP